VYKVILDTDPGIDDAMAIAYALSHPEIELLALTTVFGNVNIDKATNNAQYILDVLGAQNVCVAKGAAVPITQAPLPHAEFVHGDDGIGNCYPAEGVQLQANAAHAQLHALSAAEYIVQMATANPGQITLIAVGPLTNIALALQLEPKLPELVQQLIVMGGAVDEPGNVTPLAEANFFNDPHAADVLLTHDWPMVIVGLDVTHKIMITDTHLSQLRDHAGVTGRFLWDTSRFYVDFYSNKGAAKTLSEPCCAMHDAAAVAYLVETDAFEVSRGSARVIEGGVAAGQLALDRKGYKYATDHWADRAVNNGACMAVDAERVLASFIRTITDHRLT
jgi:inosine-uridine nucleoside N-ribohydrolase